MPAAGWRSSMVLVLVAHFAADPVERGGHHLADLRPRRHRVDGAAALKAIGLEYSYTGNATHAWLTVLLMDVWHWTPLVALLCFAGLRAIPDAYYQAASIDGASKFAVFRYIQLPKLRGVLMIAVLLRFMDSFMIYTEPFVLTGGGPGNATTFLSQYLTQKAVGQFDLGPAAAFSLIYFLIILLPVLHPLQLDAAGGDGGQGGGGMRRSSCLRLSGSRRAVSGGGSCWGGRRVRRLHCAARSCGPCRRTHSARFALYVQTGGDKSVHERAARGAASPALLIAPRNRPRRIPPRREQEPAFCSSTKHKRHVSCKGACGQVGGRLFGG